MIVRKAYKFRLKTNEQQAHKMWMFAGHSRFVWNYFWILNKRRLENKQKIMRYYEMCFWLTHMKQSDEYGFLQEAHSHILQQKLKDLDRAYKDGFDKKQPRKYMPTRKKKHQDSSFRFPIEVKVDNRRVFLPKIGWVGFYKSCEIDGKIKNATISHQAGHWYIAIQVELDIDIPVACNTNNALGVDVGVKYFCVTYDGQTDTYFLPRNSFKSVEHKLAKEQRKLKHKKRFSKNWSKQIRKIQKIHTQAANRRKNHIHQITTKISKNHAVVFVEGLKIKNNVRSAKGTIENPGKNVNAKSGLNRAILDQGWGMFRDILAYKVARQGGQVIKVDHRYTSQKCSVCGHTHKENRVSQDRFVCQSCDFRLNADANAARNILAAGRAVSACGSNLVEGRKQEPQGNRKKVPA